MSREKQRGASGKARDHGKNEQKRDQPKTTDQTVFHSSSPPSRLKLYLTVILSVLLFVIVTYSVRYGVPICIFKCAPLFAPVRNYPITRTRSEICGSPVDFNNPPPCIPI
ncbi:hypothetical protein BDW02DRAFT_565953 [Decorospora gaudefroyi]|uniref:Uncharacterized protein n=1 Tax=Decorospora gaudefroyi TaxID=184978 RepID=A0A6A5KQX9_9PLEO|nr:hypothetical protein BDW02DRAFT_565953 [Decorospora gaudefroyi]